MECPLCGKGKLKKSKTHEILFGIDLGEFPIMFCTQCGESFTDEKTTQSIGCAAKKKGIWGLGKKTAIARTGNSLAVRIPKNIATFLKLKEGKEAYIHPEGKKLVIETLEH